MRRNDTAKCVPRWSLARNMSAAPGVGGRGTVLKSRHNKQPDCAPSSGNPVAQTFQTSLIGIQVAEQAGPEQGIGRVATAVTAFVGRTLRGPVGQPVAISSFNEYQAVFGGLWQPSTLSYAVEQYFDNGGRAALIVRVVNGGRPPTLALPAGTQQLVLQALQPGTREYLRASVDYDSVGADELDRFNLVIQRVRAPRSEHVEDQEIFRRLSVRPESSRYVVDALAESQLARVLGDAPARRPERTLGPEAGSNVGYVHSSSDGNDGAPLTDYDLIGSAATAAGLFALQAADHFNFLCVPPLTRETDIGPGMLLVAARFCRERHSMLVVDPPLAWQDAAQAVQGLRDWNLHSENALMYFPRILGYDRLRGRFEQFSSCGAVAGMLARNDEHTPVWSALQCEDLTLRANCRPACSVSEDERVRLAQFGVNTLPAARAVGPPRHQLGACTLAAGNSGAADWKHLASRRLALLIISSIERATRWVVFATNDAALRRRVVEQIETFLLALDDEGAFVGHDSDESWFVVCDQRHNGLEQVRTGTVNILFGFAAQRPGEYHAYMLTHSPAGSRVRPVSVNRLETGGRRLDEEMTGTFQALGGMDGLSRH